MKRTSLATSVDRAAGVTGALLLSVALLLPTGCSVGDGDPIDDDVADSGVNAPIDGHPIGPTGVADSPDTVGVDETLTQTLIARHVFDPTVTRFNVQVYYEVGAEPYTGRLGLTLNDTWDITTESYRDLFAAHANRTVSVPDRLDRMSGFADQGVQDWDIGELTALGRSLVPPLRSGSEANVSIVFVNGLYQGNDRVLGIQPTDSPFAFVFKDVVRSVGGDATTQRYVEQATVVHELGHAIGFVDNGVPMANDHQDSDHPHHTRNVDGVMYWAVESTSGSLAFATDLITGARLSLFGPETTLDAHNYMPVD